MRHRIRQRACRALTCFLCMLPSACSTVRQPSARDVADANDVGARLGPSGAAERTILTRVATLPSGRAAQLDAETQVIAEAAYQAASGRTCRAIRVTTKARQVVTDRLACSDGDAWFFVPDVFAGSASIVGR